MHNNQQISCTRCGTCCKKNSPALHLQDLALIKDSYIPKNKLITYRKGEWLYDNVSDTHIKLTQDIIKPITHLNCIFYQKELHSCAIYDYRPQECKIQLCTDPEPLKKMYKHNRLSRSDIYAHSNPLYELILFHENKCCLDDLPQSSSDLTEKLHARFQEMIQFEYHFRFTLYQKTGMQANDMNFLLGRPVDQLLKQLGITL